MDQFSPQLTTGLNPAAAPAASASSFGIPGIARSAGPSSDNGPAWSPQNPLFWFGVFAAVTVGAIAANASVRVGKFSVQAGAGK